MESVHFSHDDGENYQVIATTMAIQPKPIASEIANEVASMDIGSIIALSATCEHATYYVGFRAGANEVYRRLKEQGL